MSGQLVYSDNSYTSPQAGYIFTTWDKLNISDINNIQISFIVKVTGVINGWASIFHISNNGKNEEGPGSRNPGIWITTLNNDPNQGCLHVSIVPQGGGNVWNNVPILIKQYYDTSVDIIISNKILKVYYNGSLVLSNSLGSSILVQPSRDVPVYVKDPWYGDVVSHNDPQKGLIHTGSNDNYMIKSLKISSFTTGITQTIGKYKMFFQDTFTTLPCQVLYNSKNNTPKPPVWADLNIKSIQNFQIGFTIKVTALPNAWSNIVHITNNNSNYVNIGDRVPGIWINNEGQGDRIYMHVATSSTAGSNNTYDFFIDKNGTDSKNNPKPFSPFERNILISWFNNRLFFSLDGNFISCNGCNGPPSAGFLINGVLTEPIPDALVYIKDPWHGPDNPKYQIKDLIFSENLNVGVQNIVRNSVLTYFPGSIDINRPDYTQLVGGTKIGKWSELNIDSIQNLQISFQLYVKSLPTYWGSIVHITNNNQDGWADPLPNGQRIPAIWINANGQNPYLLIVTSSKNNPNNNISYPLTAKSTFSPFTVDVKLLWTNNTLFVSFNGVYQNVNGFPGDGLFIEPTANAIVYAKDPFYNNSTNDSTYAIKNLSFSKINDVSYSNNSVVYSPRTYTVLRPNNKLCQWSKLGISFNSNMIVIFNINITSIKSYSRSIFKITPNDTSGTPLPSVSINPDSTQLLIINSTNSGSTTNKNESFITNNSIRLNTNTLVKIIFNGKNVSVYLNSLLDSNITPRTGLLSNPTSNSNVLVKGSDSSLDGIDNSYTIQSLTFSQLSPMSYLNYQHQGCYDDDPTGSTRVIPIDSVTVQPTIVINSIKDCARAAAITKADTFAMQRSTVPIVSYIQNKDTDYGGNDITYMDIPFGKNPVKKTVNGTQYVTYDASNDQCKEKCDNMNGCVAYTVNKYNTGSDNIMRGCWFKNRATNSQPLAQVDTFVKQQTSGNVNKCYLGNPEGTPAVDYKKFSANRQPNTDKCQTADPIFGGENVNQVYAKVGTNNIMYETADGIPKPGFLFKRWGELNIKSIANMSVSFIIRINQKYDKFRSIFRITNTENDCCNPGDRVPGLWIHPNSLLLYLTVDTQARSNNDIYSSQPLELNRITRVDIVFNKQNIKLFYTPSFDGKWGSTSLIDTRSFNSDFIEPLPTAGVYITDKYYNPIGFDLNNVTFIDTLNNMVCGTNNFCVGYEPDSNIYCYGDKKGCLWNSIPNSCNSDNDCRSMYDINSNKYTDGNSPKCPITDGSWRADACPNNYSKTIQQLPALTNPEFSKIPSETDIPTTDASVNYGQKYDNVNNENNQYSSTEPVNMPSKMDDILNNINNANANNVNNVREGFKNDESFIDSELNKYNYGNYYLLIMILIIIIVFAIIFFTLKPIGKKRSK